ncbi:probable plastid-lipid-associated protein 11, chloroplastic isoform X2 [Tripterygium wilfordii]|uniref:probable plastid-lipid-associated protein 11, chloroplastic isoform X2 n=1 Tax=Tripterygium wilfordii TaxID=458696 RepID=UPI0018F82309|nr:probable plastid-lipid-associated protein 11, chloroplastic isoform X2 [Tripterygium wilfordii]
MATCLLLHIPLKSPNPNSRTSKITCSSITDQSQVAKRNLLNLVSDQERGLSTQKNPIRRASIIEAIDALASLSKDTVTTGDSLSATWRLLWTTEKEQLFIIQNANLFGTEAGDVLQVIDVEKRTLNNVITFPPAGVFFVRSTIEIASSQRVNFRFETVYLDDEIRVVKDIRGDYLIVDRAPYTWKE